MGTLLDLEYSLRAVARSTEKATYAITYARRVKAVKAQLAKINELAPTSEIADVLAATDKISLKLNNADELDAAADKVRALAQAFSAAHTGSDLAAIDPLLPGPDTYKGTVYQPPAPKG